MFKVINACTTCFEFYVCYQKILRKGHHGKCLNIVVHTYRVVTSKQASVVFYALFSV